MYSYVSYTTFDVAYIQMTYIWENIRSANGIAIKSPIRIGSKIKRVYKYIC